MSEINKTTLVTLNEYTESRYYLGKNKYSISLSAALAKHQFTVKFTELSIDLLITLLAKDTSPSAARFVS